MSTATVPAQLTFVPNQAKPFDAGADLKADDIHVRWVMPEIFHDFPLDTEDEDEAVELLAELARKALPGAEPEVWARFGLVCALSMDGLVTIGVDYAALCVGAVGEDPCTATVFTALTDSPEDADALAAIATGLRGEDVGEVTEIQLPCGPAVSCIGTRAETLGGELTESVDDLTIPTSFIRVYVPLPNGTTLVTEMSTPTPVGWDTFSTMFGNIVSSLRLYAADGTPLILPDRGTDA